MHPKYIPKYIPKCTRRWQDAVENDPVYQWLLSVKREYDPDDRWDEWAAGVPQYVEWTLRLMRKRADEFRED